MTYWFTYLPTGVARYSKIRITEGEYLGLVKKLPTSDTLNWVYFDEFAIDFRKLTFWRVQKGTTNSLEHEDHYDDPLN